MENPNTTLSQVVAWVESKNDCSALRFEPSNYERLSRGRSHSQSLIVAMAGAANRSSQGTAEMIYSTSWGKYQIMGFNLYGECGYRGTVADFLANDAIQDNQFHTLLIRMKLIDITAHALADSLELRDHFSLVWNGSTSYNDALTEALQHFGFTVN